MSDTTYSFDSMTMAEGAAVERLSGQSLKTLDSEEAPISNLLAGIAYVFKKRDHKALTFDQVRELSFAEVSEFVSSLGVPNVSVAVEEE